MNYADLQMLTSNFGSGSIGEAPATTTPEPATIGLLALGGLAGLARGKKR